MSERTGPEGPAEFTTEEGMSLALSYLDDPSAVDCPRCGPGLMEVVCFLDAGSIGGGTVVPTLPEGNYTVVLYCHRCGRAAALDLTRDSDPRDEGGPQEGQEAA